MRSKIALAVAALAVVAVAVWAISAAGGDDDEGGGDGVSVRLWIMNNGPQPVRDTERIIAPFERDTGIDVKVQLVGWDVQFDRIRNAAVSGEGPDVTQAGTTQVPFFAALNGFEDLSGRVGDIGGKAAYAPGVWQTTEVAGRDGAWAVPWFTEARAIYYRKDLLRKAGVDPATAFSDWGAFRSTLERLKGVKSGGQEVQPFGSPGRSAFDLVHHVFPFVWDAGGAELSEDNKTSTVASPDAVEGVRFLADLLPAGLYDKSSLERDGTQVEEQFKGERIATWIGGPWTLASVPREEDDAWVPEARKNVGIAPMPAGPSGKGYTFVGGSNLMMFKNSKHQDEAWELIKFMSRDETQIAYGKLMGFFPARADAQRTVGRESADHSAFLKAILEQGRTYAPIPQWGQVETAYKDRLGNILDIAAGQGKKEYGEAAIVEELQAAQEEANKFLAQETG